MTNQNIELLINVFQDSNFDKMHAISFFRNRTYRLLGMSYSEIEDHFRKDPTLKEKFEIATEHLVPKKATLTNDFIELIIKYFSETPQVDPDSFFYYSQLERYLVYLSVCKAFVENRDTMMGFWQKEIEDHFKKDSTLKEKYDVTVQSFRRRY